MTGEQGHLHSFALPSVEAAPDRPGPTRWLVLHCRCSPDRLGGALRSVFKEAEDKTCQ